MTLKNQGQVAEKKPSSCPMGIHVQVNANIYVYLTHFVIIKNTLFPEISNRKEISRYMTRQAFYLSIIIIYVNWHIFRSVHLSRYTFYNLLIGSTLDSLKKFIELKLFMGD